MINSLKMLGDRFVFPPQKAKERKEELKLVLSIYLRFQYLQGRHILAVSHYATKGTSDVDFKYSETYII